MAKISRNVEEIGKNVEEIPKNVEKNRRNVAKKPINVEDALHGLELNKKKAHSTKECAAQLMLSMPIES